MRDTRDDEGVATLGIGIMFVVLFVDAYHGAEDTGSTPQTRFSIKVSL